MAMKLDQTGMEGKASPWVVIDNGTDISRAGFAGEEDPQVIVGSLVTHRFNIGTLSQLLSGEAQTQLTFK